MQTRHNKHEPAQSQADMCLYIALFVILGVFFSLITLSA